KIALRVHPSSVQIVAAIVGRSTNCHHLEWQDVHLTRSCFREVIREAQALVDRMAREREPLEDASVLRPRATPEPFETDLIVGIIDDDVIPVTLRREIPVRRRRLDVSVIPSLSLELGKSGEILLVEELLPRLSFTILRTPMQPKE